MKKTHNQLIINHLQRGHSITHLTALSRYRCARLAARINDLRNEGWRIATKMVSGNGARYASYCLANGKQPMPTLRGFINSI